MNGRVMTTMLLFAVAAALAPGASAQQVLALPGADEIQEAAVGMAGVEPGPNQFGTNWSWKVIPSTAFIPADSGSTYGSSFGYYWATNGGAWTASLGLPPGTEVQQVCLFVYDMSSTQDILFNWGILRLGDSTEEVGNTIVATATTNTSATPGYTTLCAGTGSPVPIRSNADADGDGDTEFHYHYVGVIPPVPVTATMRWGGLAVQWRRAISPAPATATFPNDAPTTHPFFRYIEALGASGITAGCGPGSFCPDNQLTRGEMAVFLTKALGLYWPN